MTIVTCLNGKETDVFSRTRNIFIGISLGNKYFSAENINEYLVWAVEHTKERVAILIPDKIHAINYEVRRRYTKERAEKLARKEGEKVRVLCEGMIAQLDEEKRARIQILRWEAIETDEYKAMTTVLRRAFEQDERFRKSILGIVKEHVRDEGLSDADYVKLAAYPLEELPMLVSGVNYDGTNYDLLPYPGLSSIDHLAVDLQEGKSFPELTRALQVKTTVRLLEAYADER